VLYSFSVAWQSSEIVFSTKLGKHQNSAFALSQSFCIPASIPSAYSPQQTSRLDFAFSQAYIFHICFSVFTSNFDSQHSVSALLTTGSFFAYCSQKPQEANAEDKERV